MTRLKRNLVVGGLWLLSIAGTFRGGVWYGNTTISFHGLVHRDETFVSGGPRFVIADLHRANRAVEAYLRGIL